MTRPSITIRELEESDLAAIVELINLRDEQQYSVEAVKHTVYGAEGSTVRNWLALVDGKPVGLSGWAVRELQQETNCYKAGYWQNLFIHPDYRKLMLYPQLVFAMFKGAKESNLDFIYTANRRLEVWQAHLKLGFVKTGDLAVLAKLLQPAKLVRKSKQLPPYLDAICQPLDWTYSLYWRSRNFFRFERTLSVEQLSWDSDDDLAALCRLLEEDAGDRLHEKVTANSLRARYRTNLEEDPYILLGVKVEGGLAAAIIYRAAKRGNGIYAGVIMDLVVPSGIEVYAPNLLAAVETHAFRKGCEVMLYLDGIGEKIKQVVQPCGYFKSPEQYVMLIWTQSKVTDIPSLSKLEDWRFAFGDHDAL
ncbi:MAG: hypothetical protein O9323_15960 [Microcystis sp. LE19-131.1A]|jgi:hypothetical protein|uniref:GNAT family N-acetyltransferase n=1 Tax=Microcystis sp. LE19-131.1A TaxID=3016439 RepID=UPI0022CCB34D|nr:hypothetical protein [Microcystis sp. LE19-131.1A]MCZ8243204.1 hypothetical protein [Microcystis sp. LE19-131.1A]